MPITFEEEMLHMSVAYLYNMIRNFKLYFIQVSMINDIIENHEDNEEGV